MDSSGILRLDSDRFTSLLGGKGLETAPDGDKMGAVDPYERAMEGEPPANTLEPELPCWDNGRIDSRLNQEPVEVTDSPESSRIEAAGAEFPCPDRSDSRLREVFEAEGCEF